MADEVVDERMAKAEVDRDTWNGLHPIGTPVRYWPGEKAGEGRASSTRSTAWTLGCGLAVVAVEGQSGCVAMDHVEPLDVPVPDGGSR